MRLGNKLWTRFRIIASARAVLAERGWTGLTMRAIARGANITAQAIYKHFRSKQHLVEAVIESGFKELDRDLMTRSDGKSLSDGLHAMVDEVLAFSGRYPNLTELMLRPTSHSTEVPERLAYWLDDRMRPKSREVGMFLWTQMRGVLAQQWPRGPAETSALYRPTLQRALPASGADQLFFRAAAAS